MMRHIPHQTLTLRATVVAAILATAGLAYADGGSELPDPAPLATESPWRAVFAASDGVRGVEPWITDGTRAGTHLLRNIGRDGDRPEQIRRSSFPGHFTDLGDGRVIFSARPRGAVSSEPYITDGTRAGTQLIHRLRSHDYAPQEYTPLGDGRAIFKTRNRNNRASLWVTDGTRAGTMQLRAWGTNEFPIRLTAMGDGRALFTGNFYDIDDGARYLWITDGTRPGTRILARIRTGWPGSDPNHLAALGDGRALFSAHDGVHGRELWITDGTEDGTRMVRDIRPGSVGSNPRHITPIGDGRAVFSAEDPYHELYVTDGTEAGTQLLRQFVPGVGGGEPSWFASLGDGNFLFAARTNAHGRELWRTDGTRRGTRLVRNINRDGSSDPTHITPLGDGRAVFWVNNDPRSNEIAMWVSDGTRAGTQRVRQFDGVFHRRHHLATLGDGKALFTYDDGRRGEEPWVTDGTRQGTQLLRNINRTSRSDPRGFTAFIPAQPD